MSNVYIADGFYLVSKLLNSTSPVVQTEVPTAHIIIIDCSGSMYDQLASIRQQLKNKLPMMIREGDTVTIIWFSGRKQFGVVVEAVPMKTLTDLTGVQRAIDNFLKPMGLTGFVEPLQEVAKVISRIQKPGQAVNMFFMSDGYDNQCSETEILNAIETLQPLVSSAAVVEYGWHCNKPLMVKMSERLGASEVLAENFLQYEPIFESAMTKKIIGGKKIEVSLDTPAMHGFAFTIGEGEIVTYAVDGKSVLVPEGAGEVFWFSELPLVSSDTIRPEFHHGPLTDKQVQGALYASLVPLTQRMLSNDIFRVLKTTGDVRLIRQFTNCFGKQSYQEFQTTSTECAFDGDKRLVDGYNPDEIPAEDAYTVLDLLHELAGDLDNLFYPSHPAFEYQRIGRKSVDSSGVLTEAETDRVAEIAKVLGSTSNPATIVRLQKELSALVDQERGLTFVPNVSDAGYSVSALVTNEDRPNISAQIRIHGKIDLTDALAAAPEEIKSSDIPAQFPTHIHRNYTIIRDGIRNVNVLPVSLAKKTFVTLVSHGVTLQVDGQPYTGKWDPAQIFEIDLKKLPLINRKMVKSVFAKDLFTMQYELTSTKAAQKVFGYFFDQNFPTVSAKGIADLYGVEAANWLASLGIKDYGYSPKVELAEATESYYGKELSVSISGMSSLPSVKSVIDKLAAGKKLTSRETIMVKPINDVHDLLKSSGSLNDETVQKDLLYLWLTNRKRDTTLEARRLMREISQIKFSVVVGQVWFQEFSSMDENSMPMVFEGQAVTCTANLNEIEIKV